MRWFVTAAVLLPCLLAPAAHAAPRQDPEALRELLVAIPWDPWSLLDHRLAPRRLPEQLAVPGQAHRLMAGSERFVAAADGLVSTQVPRYAQPVAIWHGYFLLDTFVAARPHEVLDVTLNLVAYQVTASRGYRSATEVEPGLTLHLHDDLGPVRADLFTLDLGALTLGRGLLLEETYVEGAMARLALGPWWLRFTVAGQVYWQLDDLFITTVGWRGVELSYLAWPQDTFARTSHHFTLAGDVPGLPPALRLGLEAALRMPQDDLGPRGAAMVRADWLPDRLGPVELHLGYQARIYQQGFGARGSDPLLPTVRASLPWREDTYLTNAFDALQPSVYVHQWWHTGMFEGIYHLTDWWALRTELEARARFFRDVQRPPRPIPLYQGLVDGPGPLLPDPVYELAYRAGTELKPLANAPHRFRLWFANKYNSTEASLGSTPTPLRLRVTDWLVALELEVFL
ncbi:MAG: hypothetical protein H6704_29935 [Myxococcales bacterium]|nr:hypothetical protein [Myxococcales bacterium]